MFKLEWRQFIAEAFSVTFVEIFSEASGFFGSSKVTYPIFKL